MAKEPQELFNGKDLTGWEGDPPIVERRGRRDRRPHDGRRAAQEQQVPDLEGRQGRRLPADARVPHRGRQQRRAVSQQSASIRPKWIVGGYQADIDSGPTYTGILYDERERGILAKRGEQVTIDRDGKSTTETIGDAAELQKSVHTDDWNEYTIEVRGPRMKHTINGKLMSETIDRDQKNRDKSGRSCLAGARWAADDRAVPQASATNRSSRKRKKTRLKAKK